jgi:IS5 family transposase
VIRRSNGQRSLFEAAIGPVEGLLDEPLRRLDVLLDDEDLVTAIAQRQAQRRPQSRWRGRPATPADVALRLLALQRLRGWNFDETEREVRASLVYRWVTHIYLGRVPDAKTLIRLSQAVGEEGVRALHARVVELAIPQAKVQGRRARIDTAVVEANIPCSTDSTLLTDGIRVLTRAMKRLDAVLRHRVRNRLRAARRRMWEIVRASRHRGQASQEQLKKSYRHLLALTRATVRDARRVLRSLARHARTVVGPGTARVITRTRETLQTFLPRVEQVVQQTRVRICRGETHYREKILSLFEPHTEIIRQRKSRHTHRVWHVVKSHEADRGVVVDYDVCARRPSDKSLLLPAIQRHHDIFGRSPRLV